MEQMIRYVSPVNPAVSEIWNFPWKTQSRQFFQIYPILATILLAIGISLAAWFFVFEVSRNKLQKESIIFKVYLRFVDKWTFNWLFFA